MANLDDWLRKHKRFHLHFTATSSSWLDPEERWFRELTDKALRRGSFNCPNSSPGSRNTSPRATRTQTIRLDSHRRLHPGERPSCRATPIEIVNQ
jgi:hypothetical protein